MAKRKSTDKPSSNDSDDVVETPSVAEDAKAADAPPTDPDTIADAVEAVETYAPATPESDPDSPEAPVADQNDSLADAPTDEVIELAEPDRDGSPEPSETDGSADAAEETSDDAERTDPASQDDAHISEDEAEQLIEDAELVEPDKVQAQTLPPPAEKEIVRETVVERKGGLVPTLIGGAVAAVLGYGVAAYVSQDVWPFATAEDDTFATEMRDALATQESTVAGLAERLSTLEGVEPPTVDLSPIESRITEVQDSVASAAARLDEVAARLDGIVGRIDTLEKQPLEQAVSPEAIAAYERALADLQAEVEAQRAEVAQMAREAIQAEGAATEQAQLAAARAAMAEVTAALETGAGFESALNTLSLNGFNVPDALSAVAAGGVATQVQLIESFPEAARSALSAVRSSETETTDGSNRIATFFANQLGARSVAPRDGDDVDAILSRSEAALRAGDLSAAIAELSSLPELAQTAMADWASRAETRLEAKTAADALVQQLLQK